MYMKYETKNKIKEQGLFSYCHSTFPETLGSAAEILNPLLDILYDLDMLDEVEEEFNKRFDIE